MQSTKPILILALVAILVGCASDRTPTQVPPKDVIADSPEDLIQLLAEAYRTRDQELFKSLLAEGVNAPEYLFILDPAADGEQWGYTEEARIHQRMFEPENTLAGQAPVPAEYWLVAITTTLTKATDFTERVDLYQSPVNPTGLSPTRWKAFDAIYLFDVLLDTQGVLDYQVTGHANFVVIEDLEMSLGQVGKFKLLIWFDICTASKSSVEERCWGNIKALYK